MLGRVGRSVAGALGRRSGSAAFAGLMGMSAAAGLASAVTDSNNGFGDFQEAIWGDRNAIRYSARAAVVDSFTDNPSRDVLNIPLHSYYGTPFNSRAARRRPPTVDGSMVFGQFNMR